MNSNTKRVAKNTLMLYVRQIFVILVALYTSRVALSVLGVSDYGIYNVVGGLVAMFNLVSGSMSITISRFITIEVGKQNQDKIREIFSTSLIIQYSISVVVIILCETVGTWFIYHKLNIPQERLNASFLVMQCSLLTFVVRLISIPFNSLIVAHEKMSAFAYISILETGLNFLAVFFLKFFLFDKLKVYAILLFLVSLIIRFIYSCYCRLNFKNESSFVFKINKDLFIEMRQFIGWSFLGNGIIVIKDYGTNILLNLFCGTVMNAARGIAGQVNGAAMSFVTNFMMALNPQITKSYAEKDLSSMHSLIIRGQKFGFYILFMLFILFAPNINFILNLWLTEVPPHTANLVVLILIYSLAQVYANPLITGVLAEGNIRNYELSIVVIYAVNFILSYFILKFGYSVEWVFVSNIIFKFIVCISLLIHSRFKYSFPLKSFFVKCICPTFAISVISLLIIFLLHSYGAESFVCFFAQSFINCSICTLLIFLFGLTKGERNYLLKIAKSKLSHMKSKDSL